MTEAQVTFPLAPAYARAGIEFVQARATELHPEGNADHAEPHIVVEKRAGGTMAQQVIPYDFLINATGPKKLSGD